MLWLKYLTLALFFADFPQNHKAFEIESIFLDWMNHLKINAPSALTMGARELIMKWEHYEEEENQECLHGLFGPCGPDGGGVAGRPERRHGRRLPRRRPMPDGLLLRRRWPRGRLLLEGADPRAKVTAEEDWAIVRSHITLELESWHLVLVLMVMTVGLWLIRPWGVVYSNT